jgi:hypothetical protein
VKLFVPKSTTKKAEPEVSVEQETGRVIDRDRIKEEWSHWV